MILLQESILCLKSVILLSYNTTCNTVVPTVDIVGLPLENCFITNEFIDISQIKNNNILYKFYQS